MEPELLPLVQDFRSLIADVRTALVTLTAILEELRKVIEGYPN